MKVMCAHTDMVPIETLVPNPRNPNQHSEEQIKFLAKIIKHQGWRDPIVVSKRSGFMTKGHGRLMAAKLNGWGKIPVDKQDYASEADEYADMVADNEIARLAETNIGMIYEDAIKFEGLDFDLLGIPGFELPQTLGEPGCEEDEVPEQVEAKTKLGDLYQLGKHRLLCGDSTDILQVEKLMDGEKADMVFTDPPYGMNLDTDFSSMKGWHQGKKYKPVIGDNQDFKPELIQTLFGIFAYCSEIILWGADYYAELLLDKNKGSWGVWDKRVDESKDAMYGSCFELFWSKNKHKRLIFRKMWAGFMGDAEASKRVHPTQKPTELITKIFDEWANGLTNIIDLFGGSGSTLIACEKTNRKCFMMELDPHYCDVIIARWEKYTGQKAELIKT